MYLRSASQLLLLCVIMLLMACSRDGSDLPDDGDGEGDENRVGGRLMGELTLQGVAGTDRPLAWYRLCAQDVAEGELFPLCTSTSELGNYQMQGLFFRRGLLETGFMDDQGNDQALYGFFDLSSARSASRADLHPLTDVAVRAYLAQTDWPRPADCFDDMACSENLNNDLDTARIETISNGLITLLGPLWPQGLDPLATPFLADPSLNSLASLYERVQFDISADADGGADWLLVRPRGRAPNCDTEQILAEVQLDRLASEPLDARSVFTPEDETALVGCRAPAMADAFELTVSADPPQGDSPLTTDITIETAGASNEVFLNADLVNPRGQTEASWSAPTEMVTLEQSGRYLVTVRAVSNGSEVFAGLEIEVDGTDRAAEFATWGQAGSCAPQASDVGRFENICLERLDGSINPPGPDTANCVGLVERPELIYSIGICSQQTQYDGELLGICTQFERQARVFHYQNSGPSHGTETATAQHDRNRARCELVGGDWDSFL